MKDKITCADVQPIRKAMGLNMKEFAGEIGASPSSVFVWENAPEDSEKRIHPLFAAQLRRLKKKYLGDKS